MLSYMLLRLGLKLEYDISEKPNFRLDSNGKPQLEQWPNLHMNISHCAETVACAVDFAEVGVDVQNTEAYSKQLGKRVLTHKEQAQISQDPWPDRRFTEIWSLKEAYGKYRGNGVLYDLFAVDFSAISQGWTYWNDLNLYLYTSQRYALSFCGKNQLAVRRICVQELMDLLASLDIK